MDKSMFRITISGEILILGTATGYFLDTALD
jgi:hypothetical protein